MRRDTRSLCEKTNGDLKRPGYHYRHGHQDISDSDWTETSSDSNDSDESSIVFPNFYQGDVYTTLLSHFLAAAGDVEVSSTVLFLKASNVTQLTVLLT